MNWIPKSLIQGSWEFFQGLSYNFLRWNCEFAIHQQTRINAVDESFKNGENLGLILEHVCCWHLKFERILLLELVKNSATITRGVCKENFKTFKLQSKCEGLSISLKVQYFCFITARWWIQEKLNELSKNVIFRSRGNTTRSLPFS